VENQSLFHWSGENDVLERHIAGERLYEYLSHLDESGQPYHVIAHSHGGSVLWAALRIAEQVRLRGGANPLNGLRSCIAVGTPFVIYRQSRNSTRLLWFQEVVTMLLIVITPFAALYLLWENARWLLFVLVIWIFAIPIVVAKTFPLKFSRMQQHDPNIAREHGNGWLSIWSPDDEALNALRSAIRLRDTPISFRLSRPILPAHASNLGTRWFFVGNTISVYLVDWLIAPIATRFVRRRIAASVLGVPFVKGVQRIEPWPCDEMSNQPPLPQATCSALKVNADRQWLIATPSVRDALRSIGSGSSANPLLLLQDKALQGLIHTSYFKHEEVIDTIVQHISMCSECYRNTDVQ
jgi:hypothetical protein